MRPLAALAVCSTRRPKRWRAARGIAREETACTTATAPKAPSRFPAPRTASSGSRPAGPARGAAAHVAQGAAWRTCSATRTAGSSAASTSRPSSTGTRPPSPASEIAFHPGRVLLQDFTGVPAVVDLAAMREAIVKLGGDPRAHQPPPARRPRHRPLRAGRQLRHADASLDRTPSSSIERNSERYAFLNWGQQAFNNFRVVPPDTGICHQVNLEYLARVVCDATDGRRLPRHPRRHRLAHHDDQRPRRGRLGRRRHRGRGRHARPAALDAPPPGRRLQARPARCREGATATDLGAHRHPDAAQEGRRRKVRRVLRPGRRRPRRSPTAPPSPTWRPNTAPPSASSPSTTRPSTTCASPAAPRSRSPWSRPTARSRACGAPTTRPIRLQRHARARPRRRRALPRRPQAPAGPRAPRADVKAYLREGAPALLAKDRAASGARGSVATRDSTCATARW